MKGKLPETSILRRLSVIKGMSTRRIAAKYHTDPTTVSLALRKIGLSSSAHQNWGSEYRVWKGLSKRPEPETEPRWSGTQLCMLCINPVPKGRWSSHLKEDHGLERVDVSSFFIPESELQ